MNVLATQEQQLELRTIARECAADFESLVQAYRTNYKLSTEDAVARARGNAEEQSERILRSPHDQIRWHDIDQVAALDGQKALDLWEAIKREALEQLRSGHRAAQAMQTADNYPWRRAQFLAIRQELSEEWQPRNGIERQLIDTMALAQSGHLFWLETLTCRSTQESLSEKKQGEEARWTPPRLSDAAAIEQAAAMMDRFNKVFLRSLRALQDQRRNSRPVVVQKVGQVNVGGQQVNVAPG
jgi:hypothetical protein